MRVGPWARTHAPAPGDDAQPPDTCATLNNRAVKSARQGYRTTAATGAAPSWPNTPPTP
ncbi:hypothetical protein GCM10010244_28840 [Streptomyces coeruleorubidus]|nr:hypothetical protein GCM10010244_28840 [Streptomyces bellus]